MKTVLLRIYFFCRLPFLSVLRIIGRKKARSDIRSILVIRLDRLGDFVLFLPVIAGLRRAFPCARIDVLVTPYLEQLARRVPAIDGVKVYRGFAVTIAEIFRRGYDLAVDGLHDYGLKSALVAYFSGAGTRVGFAAGFRELLFTRSVRMIAGQHMIEANLGLLKALGLEPAGTVPVFSLPGRPEARNTIILHPGAYFPSQRWPREYFIEAGAALSGEIGAKIVVIGSARERELVRAVAGAIRGAEAVFSPLGDLPGVLAGSALFIGNNSGPLHLAAALGVPTVSVMGPTDPVLFRPRGGKNITLRKNLACSPCAKPSCRSHECLREIRPGEVVAAAQRLLGREG